MQAQTYTNKLPMHWSIYTLSYLCILLDVITLRSILRILGMLLSKERKLPWRFGINYREPKTMKAIVIGNCYLFEKVSLGMPNEFPFPTPLLSLDQNQATEGRGKVYPAKSIS